MAWYPTQNRLGIPNIYSVSSTQAMPEGTIIQANDAATSGYGGGEFIYLKGVASTVVGSLVTYNPYVHSTTLTPNTANLAQPVAVAMAACLAGEWGFYQIAGAAVIKKTAVKVNPNVALFQSGTAGRVMSTAASGKELLNARSLNAATVASATSTIIALIQRPFLQGATA